MQRLLMRLLTVAIVFVLAVTPALAQPAGETALLRFVHVIPAAAAVDVYIDGQLAIAELGFGEASSYVQVDAGARAITVTQRGVTTTLWQQEVTAAAGTALTLVASSTEPLGFQVYPDDLNPLGLGTARLTALHAAATAPTLDIILTDGRTVMPGLEYNQPYGTLDLPAAVYDIAAVPAGDTIENASLLPVSLKLNGGTSYMAVIYGAAAQPSLLLLSAPAQAAANSGYVRFVQATSGASVDVFLDDVVVAPALNLEDAGTEFIALPEGEYSLAARASGSDTDLITDTIEVAAGDRFTLLVQGAGDDAELVRADDPVSTISAEETVLNIINATTSGTVSAFAADAEVLGSVAAGESDSAILEPSDEGLTAAVEVGGASETVELLDVIYGGVYYTLLAVDGEDGAEVLLLKSTSLAQTADSAPGDRTVTVVTQAETTEVIEPVPPIEVAAATAEPTTAAQEPVVPEATEPPQVAVTAAPGGPTARVLVDPGANLHVRQYPSSDAFSLARAPSGALLSVIGRQGAEQLAPEETPEPEATEFVDPAFLLTDPDQDLDPVETWLFVTFRPAEGGEIDGWVNAFFLTVSDTAGRSQRLAELPTVPSNRAGEARQFTSDQLPPTATPMAADQVLATVLLNEGANLHLRRNPDPAAESLQLIPSGAQIVITGRIESGTWLRATYQGQQGWIASEYVTLALNGAPYQAARLDVISTPTPTPTPEATPAS